MESIAQALQHMSNDARWKQARERLNQLLEDPLIVQLREKYPFLQTADLELHANRLLQYVTEYRHCSHCPGLERCPNDFVGHYTMLSVERFHDRSYIHDRKTPCKKWNAEQAKLAVLKRVKSFYIDDSALEQAYSIDEIIGMDRERAKAVDQLVEYILTTKEHGLQQRGLYLVGSFGTGKTFLMCYMLHELAKIGHSGVIVYMPDFMEDLKAMISEPGKLQETIELLKTTDLLVFDDIGAEQLNPWARDHVLGTILNYRMNRKPTFFTSNHPLAALEKHFSFTNKDGEEEHKGRRLMERIAPFVDVVAVNGENKRGKI